MAKFDSKSFNAQAFGAYVKQIPNVKKAELAKSGAVGSNEQAKAALSNQTGNLYARIPYFGRISGATSQNNDGGTDITSTNTTTYEQGFVTASRMDSWTERSFSKNITAGVDFMDNVAVQIGGYKQEVKQTMLLKILKGVFSMKTDGDSVTEKAAKEFIEKHTFDISGKAGDEANVGAATLNAAIQKACGDNKEIFKLVLMHSTVATNLENLRLLKYLTYTDKDGITRDLEIGTWNGRTVLVDDGMPVTDIASAYAKTTDTALTDGKTYYTRSGSSGNYVYTAVSAPNEANIGNYYEATEFTSVYTTYVLGNGAIILDDIGDSVPYEMNRDPAKNGGQDTLYVRDRYICGVDGISFEKPAALTASASNADLENGENWQIINDGATAISHKAIAIARIISKG